MNYRALVLALVVGLGLPVLAQTQTLASVEGVHNIRPRSLMPLYAGVAVSQALDLQSSHLAISRGAHEANPIVRDIFTNHLWSSVILKAGVTTAVVVGAEHLWKQKHPHRALTLAIAVLAVQTGLDVRNYRIAAQSR